MRGRIFRSEIPVRQFRPTFGSLPEELTKTVLLTESSRILEQW